MKYYVIRLFAGIILLATLLSAQPAASRELSSASGGPDEYGYRWEEVPFDWKDATGGTDTGLSGGGRNPEVTAAIPLGFTFPFYNEARTSVYVNTAGAVTFDQYAFGYYSWIEQNLPNPSSPNDYIGAYISELGANSRDYTGKIYTLAGGSGTDHTLTIEWYQVSDGIGGQFTFEIVLHENGNFELSYLTMTHGSSRHCNSAAGIENGNGSDGLAYIQMSCPIMSTYSGKTVRFTRPAPTVRILLQPLTDGAFTSPGGTSVFQVDIGNEGDLGLDTFDLASTSTWPMTLYASDGISPLTDSDLDGKPDTGAVPLGGGFRLIAKMTAPGGAAAGDYGSADITATSSIDTGKSKTAHLQAAIAAPFTQAYQGSTMDLGIDLNQPGGQAHKSTTTGLYNTADLAIAEAPNGNIIYAWTRYDWPAGCPCQTSDIEFTILNRYGDTLRPVTKLTDNTRLTPATEIQDREPVVAVAQDGSIGIAWTRKIFSSSGENDNIYFVVLDASGKVRSGPTNLSNNLAIGVYFQDMTVPLIFDPGIAATEDNRFVISWNQNNWYHSPCPVTICVNYRIFFAVRSTSGAQVKAATQLIADSLVDVWEGYSSPRVTALSGNRFLVTTAREADDDLYYIVFDSGGNNVKSLTRLTTDEDASVDWGADPVQLSDGKVFIAWTGNVPEDEDIRYAVLDASYSLAAGPSVLGGSAATHGKGYVSVAAAPAGQAVLTWMDVNEFYRNSLYYALLNSSGSLVTPAMPYRSPEYPVTSYFTTSTNGSGNTSRSGSFASGVDTAIWPDKALVSAPPGSLAPVTIHYSNRGQTPATSVTVTATLAAGLSYDSDDSGVAPVVAGNTLTWSLPDLGFLEAATFTLNVNVAGGTSIPLYTVHLTVTADGIDANPLDNSADLVVGGYRLFLPYVRR